VPATTDAPLDVRAVRFAAHETRRSSSYLRWDVYGQADATFTISYFFWVVRGPHDVLLLDTGFDQPVAARRGQELVAPMRECLAAAEVDPGEVGTIVLSHLHFDHVGNLELFPQAELVVQAAELEFWSDPIALRPQFASVAERSYLDTVARADAAGRIRRITGDTTLAPGITAISLPGHTPGQQGLRIDGADHGVVLASDAVHYYDELRHDMTFVIVHDVAEMYRSYDRLRAYETSGDVVVPGHDTEVLDRFPTEPFGQGGVIVDLTAR
jgi:glyoxylase-like metal-dependent hydrolase (beta-lactamase superfamily II)